MTAATKTFPFVTLDDLLEHLGRIDPRRIRLVPAPGTATEQDVIRLGQKEDRLYELIDGVLVEKIMGAKESFLGLLLGRLLSAFVDENNLGFVLGADGTLRILPRMVRIPDVAFVSRQRWSSPFVPDEPIPDLVPDLAVEVISEGNTPGEMRRKLKDYFLAGVRLVWFVDPDRRTVEVYTAPDKVRRLREGQTLDGSDVLPGFSVPLKVLFARIRPAPKKRKK
jgi:Uma2 family endonuclease